MGIQDIRELFIPNRIGRLMKMEENEQTRYQYEVWFEYTRQTMIELKEGTLLAVKNFATDRNATHYSVLEIISIMPVHYALGGSLEGYPGFIMEAARNLASDWTSQEDRSEEDTTIIRCIAIPTGIEIVESQNGRNLSSDRSLPMIGSEVRVLTSDATKEIVNRDISPEDYVFEGGTWLVNDTVQIFVRTEDLIRTHFGIFGFTGAGKSNLVSTYIANILTSSQQRRHPVKIVLFDIMSEYTALLIDQLLELEHAWILAIGENTLPGSVVEFLSGRNEQRQNAINHLVGSTLYPKSLEKIKDKFQLAFQLLLDKRKIRLYQPPIQPFRKFLDENENILTKGNLGNSRAFIQKLLQDIRELYEDKPLTPETATLVKEYINQQLEEEGKKLSETAKANINEFKRLLDKIPPPKKFPQGAIMTLRSILEELNNPNHCSLIIVQAHDPDDLRDFSYEIGKHLYEVRRRIGRISPLVSFIFDEADEFIPGQYEKESSYARSAWIAETLARRGRKFGIGIGICTQRVRYLKASVMAQPHTYLISKMPRKSDREAVQEAFGFSEDMFLQTFKFAPGDWLLASHDATGLKSVPIPIHVPDANERIKNFLEEELSNILQRSRSGQSRLL